MNFSEDIHRPHPNQKWPQKSGNLDDDHIIIAKMT